MSNNKGPKRRANKALGERILCCIRLTNNAVSLHATAAEWAVCFDRGPQDTEAGLKGHYHGDMCGRYALKASVPELARTLGVEPPIDFTQRFNIAPTQMVPALHSVHGQRAMRWELASSWCNEIDAGSAMHNARIDSLALETSLSQADSPATIPDSMQRLV